ncbi:MAG: hypothetical protein MSC31_06965 [Solirubrobacteraceae bacterium MAG38_C4-C5]|nr:hypothetical protein [Candidatus Siliceabacter maunaloa]
MNPFVYSRPLSPKALVDREGETGTLLDLALGGHNSRLSAPRRYGKTSLIGKVFADADDRDRLTTVVYVNFAGVLSVDDVARRIERAYRDLRGPLRGWLEGALRTLRPTVAPPGTGLSVAPSLESASGERLLALLDLPRRVHERSGRRCLVAYDEFQEVLATSPPVDGAMRSVIEQHGEHASYVFAGSHPGMMRTLFSDRQRPFYGQARPVELLPLRASDLAEDISEQFSRTDREPAEALGPLLDIAAGHPQRAMLLAHHLWERTPVGGAADEGTFQMALEAVYAEVADLLTQTWAALDPSERRVLALVAYGGRITSQRDRESADLARSTARDALGRLVAEGHMQEIDGDPVIVDPLLARWVAGGRQAAL